MAATGSSVVLADVSLSIPRGEIVALVGPNGAGKTTVAKIVSGLLEPSVGKVLIGGIDMAADARAARSRLGVVLADDRGLYWRLTARQNLEFFGVMSGLRRGAARGRAGEMLQLVRLADDDKLVFGYSSGMRSRLSLARALLADPPMVVLDEPTRSLDEASSSLLWMLVRQLASEGKAVLVCTHDLDSVRRVCDRMVVLIRGQVRLDASIADLTAGDTPSSVMASLVARDAAPSPG